MVQCYLKSPSQREVRGLESEKGGCEGAAGNQTDILEVGERDYESRNVGVLCSWKQESRFSTEVSRRNTALPPP